MQKQQRDTQTVFLKKRVSPVGDLGWNEVSIVVDRYKLKNAKIFKDGFKLEVGELLRKVVGSEEENGCFNVVFEGDSGIKRMFWIEKNQLELQSSSSELWSDDEIKNEINDRLENWFE